MRKLAISIFIAAVFVVSCAASVYASPNDWLVPWQKGVTSTLSQGYDGSWSHGHGFEIDFPLASGTRIYAPASGTILQAGWDTQGYGFLIKIRTDDGYDVLLAHNSQIVKASGRVTRGEFLSYSGATGNTTGPHIHFEARLQGTGLVNNVRSSFSSIFGEPIAAFAQKNVGKTKLTGQCDGSAEPAPNPTPAPTPTPAPSPNIAANQALFRANNGRTVTKGYGGYANAGQIGLPNDSIEYIQVGADMKVVTYDNDNYDGQSWVFEAGEHTMEYSQKNNISSFVVINKHDGNATKPGWTPPETPAPAPAVTILPKVEAVSAPLSAKAGDTVSVTVYTNTETTKVCFVNEQQEKCAEATGGYTTVGNQRKWVVNWGTVKPGVRQIAVYAGNSASDYSWDREYMEWFYISLTEPEPAPAPVVTLPTVEGLSAPSSAKAGDTVSVTVYTNTQTTKVCFVNEQQEKCAEATGGYTTVGNRRIWTVNWGTVKPGYRRIAVYAGNDSSDYSWDRQYMEWFFINLM
jgi:ribosomal 50S subunit-recycling heat shock protein